MTTAKAIRHVKKHPAEYGAAGVWASVSALLQAFGVSADHAIAIAGVAAAVAPAILTFMRNKGWI